LKVPLRQSLNPVEKSNKASALSPMKSRIVNSAIQFSGIAWDRVDAVKSAGELAVDRSGGVSIISQIHGSQRV
jgi:hypothetical protein